MPGFRIATVLGAANSGKSRFAEGLVLGAGGAAVYVATARHWGDDAEMAAKIAAHRAGRGPEWCTREVPLELAAALGAAAPGEALLVDCVTMWLSNLLLDGLDPEPAVEGLLEALQRAPGPAVLVTNEVGAGVVPQTALGRAFRSAQGRLNQRLAAGSDLVVLVTAGLPLALKGQLP